MDYPCNSVLKEITHTCYSRVITMINRHLCIGGRPTLEIGDIPIKLRLITNKVNNLPIMRKIHMEQQTLAF